MAKKRNTQRSLMEQMLARFRRDASEKQRIVRSISETTKPPSGAVPKFTAPNFTIPKIIPLSEQFREILEEGWEKERAVLEKRWEEERRESREATKRNQRWNIAALVIATLALLVSAWGTFGGA